MNVIFDTLAPLPSALDHRPHESLRRRHRIGDHDPDRDALQHFNAVLRYLDFPQAPLDGDQLASAARALVDETRLGGAPRCIQQRMRRGAAIDLMAEDPDWETRDETAVRIGIVVADYLRGSQAVIPNALPVVGHLDDAIVVEAAWPAVAMEVRQYLAFCHVRHVEAQLRGESSRHFGFTREQWRAAIHAEVDWIAHCERVGQASYLPSDPRSAFQVH
ncbi:MAG: hypothetical protein ACYC42_07145 [Lysobacter sp.]